MVRRVMVLLSIVEASDKINFKILSRGLQRAYYKDRAEAEALVRGEVGSKCQLVTRQHLL
jgi:hypothetical protein